VVSMGELRKGVTIFPASAKRTLSGKWLCTPTLW